MWAPTYQDPARVEVLRAVGVGVTILGSVALVLMGGSLFEGDDPSSGLAALAVFTLGLCTLLWSRTRLTKLWAHNKPYLLSEEGATLLHERREAADRTLWVGRILLALFIVFAIVFFFLFSAISCGERSDGYCGNVGRPTESIVVASQITALALGCSWAAVTYWRRRQDDETERIDMVVAEGQRRRRSDHPLSGTDRRSWE